MMKIGPAGGRTGVGRACAVAGALLLATSCGSPQPTATTASRAEVAAPSNPGTIAPPTTTTPTTLPTIPTSVPGEPIPDPGAPSPALPEGDSGVAVVAAGGAGVAALPDGAPLLRAHEGLIFPVLDREGRWLLVETPCDDTAWIDGAEVSFTPTIARAQPRPDRDMASAVIVLDPGHGGPNTGAVGPMGTAEKGLNLDIARRTRDLLTTSHSVDWTTGEIFDGDAVDPAGTVWLTRTEGPPGADIETGLIFRATLANVAGADALVSIHNNASPDGPAAATGAEAYYRVRDVESKRLAGLIVEELRRSFGPFEADWAGALDAGAKYRLRSDGETDLYGVLKNATVPAVLVEGAYLSNAAEESLLLTPEFRQAYADGLYRALVRFLTTDDPGSGFVEPINRTASPGSGSPQPSCTIPAQP